MDFCFLSAFVFQYSVVTKFKAFLQNKNVHFKLKILIFRNKLPKTAEIPRFYRVSFGCISFIMQLFWSSKTRNIQTIARRARNFKVRTRLLCKEVTKEMPPKRGHLN